MNKSNINETIEKLLVIQEKDVSIMRFRREIDDIPARRKEIENGISAAREAVQKAKNESNAHQSGAKKIELEIESVRSKIAKLREQQFQLKSNNEFKALNKEIVGMNNEISAMEEREITFMEQAENARLLETKAKNDLASMEKNIVTQLRELDERKANLGKEVELLQADRDARAGDVAAEYMRIYNRIIENKKDQALVSVDNNICAGCHMKLTAQIICDLKKRENLIICSFCGRILYLAH